MPVDPETKRRIIDLSLNEHKTIREITRITKKSSRDIIAVLRNSEHNGKAEENKNNHGNNIPTPKIETGDTEYDLPPNIKAYKLFSKGKSLVEVTIELKLRAQQAQQFNTEYWKLVQMDYLFMIYEEVKNNLGYFLKLFRLGKKEGLTPENIISFLNRADNAQDLSEQFQSHLKEVKALELRKNRSEEQLEDLENRTISAQEQLSHTERACKQKFDELSGICTQARMVEYQIDLLIDKIPTPYNSLGSTQSLLYEGDYQYVKEKVLEIADNTFHNLQKGVVNSAISKAVGLGKRNIYSREMAQSETGDTPGSLISVWRSEITPFISESTDHLLCSLVFIFDEEYCVFLTSSTLE